MIKKSLVYFRIEVCVDVDHRHRTVITEGFNPKYLQHIWDDCKFAKYSYYRSSLTYIIGEDLMVRHPI